MNTNVCDICHRVESHCSWALRKKLNLRYWQYDGWCNVDICDDCMNKIKSMVRTPNEK